MSNDLIRIILVDDHKMARESWRMLLAHDKRFVVIHESANGEDAIDQTRRLVPDILLVDINMHPLNGFEVTRKVLEENPLMKIIGISVNNQPSYAGKMLDLGAMGFVTKGCTVEEVIYAINEVFAGRRYVCKEIINMMA